MLTDVAGVLDPEGKAHPVHPRVEDAAGPCLQNSTAVTGALIPSSNCCIDAIEQGVEKVMIVDGRVENCVLLELLTPIGGAGTGEIVGEAERAGEKRRCGKAVLDDPFTAHFLAQGR